MIAGVVFALSVIAALFGLAVVVMLVMGSAMSDSPQAADEAMSHLWQFLALFVIGCIGAVGSFWL